MGVACLEIRGENFREWLKNHEIRESFLLRKFPAIRYIGLTALPLEVQKIGRDLGSLPRGKTPAHQSTSVNLVCKK